MYFLLHGNKKKLSNCFINDITIIYYEEHRRQNDSRSSRWAGGDNGRWFWRHFFCSKRKNKRRTKTKSKLACTNWWTNATKSGEFWTEAETFGRKISTAANCVTGWCWGFRTNSKRDGTNSTWCPRRTSARMCCDAIFFWKNWNRSAGWWRERKSDWKWSQKQTTSKKG